MDGTHAEFLREPVGSVLSRYNPATIKLLSEITISASSSRKTATGQASSSGSSLNCSIPDIASAYAEVEDSSGVHSGVAGSPAFGRGLRVRPLTCRGDAVHLLVERLPVGSDLLLRGGESFILPEQTSVVNACSRACLSRGSPLRDPARRRLRIEIRDVVGSAKSPVKRCGRSRSFEPYGLGRHARTRVSSACFSLLRHVADRPGVEGWRADDGSRQLAVIGARRTTPIRPRAEGTAAALCPRL